ncbi:hypothetical protein MAPG_11866, partial [Magnaporthiopsis poae ATCC 64411]
MSWGSACDIPDNRCRRCTSFSRPTTPPVKARWRASFAERRSVPSRAFLGALGAVRARDLSCSQSRPIPRTHPPKLSWWAAFLSLSLFRSPAAHLLLFSCRPVYRTDHQQLFHKLGIHCFFLHYGRL